MVRIHIYRTVVFTFCGLDHRAPKDGHRAVTEAHYARAAGRFAAGVVPGACMDCVEAHKAFKAAALKALTKARRAARKARRDS